MQSVQLNNEQRLFVISCEDGYTCLGFDVCKTRSDKLEGWLLTHGTFIPVEQPLGTIDAYNRYTELCGIASKVCRDKKIRCNVELIPELVGKEGQRVEVTDCYDEKRRFIVRKSTGWMPVHLEIKTKRSTGGHAVMGTPYKNVKWTS